MWRDRAKERKGGGKNPVALVGLTAGFTLKHEILHINILGLLSLQRLILEILPGEQGQLVLSLVLPSPFCTKGCRGFPWLRLRLWRLSPRCTEGGCPRAKANSGSLGSAHGWAGGLGCTGSDSGSARVSGDRGVRGLPSYPRLWGLLVRAELQVHPPRPAGTKPLPMGLGDALWFKVPPVWPARLWQSPLSMEGTALQSAWPDSQPEINAVGANLSGFHLAEQRIT